MDLTRFTQILDGRTLLLEDVKAPDPKAEALANLETALACLVAAKGAGFSEALELMLGSAVYQLDKLVVGARIECKD